MPQTVYTAYDTGGQTKMTDMDQIAEQRRREMADQAFRGALLNNQNNMTREGWGRQDALTERNLGAQERIAQMGNQTQLAMGGTFQDRTAANQQLAQMQMRPAQTMADLEASKWQEGSGLRGSQNALTQEINTAKLNAIRGGMGGQGGGNSRLAAALMGVNPDQLEDPQDRMVRQTVMQALAQRLASGEINPQQFQAGVKGDYSGIPQKQVTAIAPEQLGEDLRSKSKGFLTRDTSSVGLDPGESQDEEIVALRDKYFRALKIEQPRLSDEQALEAANYLAERELTAEGVGWGSRDASDRLLRRLRGQAPRTGAMAGTDPGMAQPFMGP